VSPTLKARRKVGVLESLLALRESGMHAPERMTMSVRSKWSMLRKLTW